MAFSLRSATTHKLQPLFFPEKKEHHANRDCHKSNGKVKTKRVLCKRKEEKVHSINARNNSRNKKKGSNNSKRTHNFIEPVRSSRKINVDCAGQTLTEKFFNINQLYKFGIKARKRLKIPNPWNITLSNKVDNFPVHRKALTKIKKGFR